MKPRSRALQTVERRGGFTLPEVLLAIGIIATLSTIAVVSLNPSEALKESRDTKRIADVSSINAVLSKILYSQSRTNTSLASSTIYVSLPDDTSTACASLNLPPLQSPWAYHCVPSQNVYNIDGTGWIPLNFKTAGVTDLPILPLDPINSSSSCSYYSFIPGASNLVVGSELAANLESSKYRSQYSSSSDFLTSGVFTIGTIGTSTAGTVYDCNHLLTGTVSGVNSSITAGALYATSTP